VNESERWILIDGHRWCRSDPALDSETPTALRIQLEHARAAVRSARLG